MSMDRSSSKLSEVSEDSESLLDSIKEINKTTLAKPAPLQDMKVFMHHSSKRNKGGTNKKKIRLNKNQIMIRQNLISPVLKRQFNNSGKEFTSHCI